MYTSLVFNAWIITKCKSIQSIMLSHTNMCWIARNSHWYWLEWLQKLMPSVEYLDLSHNKLEDIQHLQHLSSLTYVNLSHNRFTALNSLHTKLGNIKTLVLHNNKLESLLGMFILHKCRQVFVVLLYLQRDIMKVYVYCSMQQRFL